MECDISDIERTLGERKVLDMDDEGEETEGERRRWAIRVLMKVTVEASW